MNSLFANLGALGWKPALSMLLLPPVPLLLLLLLGLWWRRRRTVSGSLLVVMSLLGLWFSQCRVSADWLEAHLLHPPAVLVPADLPALKRSLAGRRPVVLVLGGGADVYAPEFDGPMLSDHSLQRLHYGLWLARRLDAPVMFSGGVGRAQRSDSPGTTEADTAARIAERDYGRPLRWLDNQSADTRGNARASLPVLSREGLSDVLLVTHRWHMPRALRAFQEAVEPAGLKLRFMAAPMGAAASSDARLLDWLPSNGGQAKVRNVLREWFGWIAGA